MAISFMVLAGPRSATTWLSNLLTTDHTLCMHDPLLEYTTLQLDQVTIPGKRLGIADTTALLWPVWLNLHTAKKIVVWRDPEEINHALIQLGLARLDVSKHAVRISALDKKIKVYDWRAVFEWRTAKEICDRFDVPIDKWRFHELRKMNVQPEFSRLPVSKEAIQQLVTRIVEEYNS